MKPIVSITAVSILSVFILWIDWGDPAREATVLGKAIAVGADEVHTVARASGARLGTGLDKGRDESLDESTVVTAQGDECQADAGAPFPTPAHVYGTNTVLYQIEAVETYGNRTVVLTQSAPALHLFENGALVRSWGERGNGPGQLNNVRDLVLQDSDAVVANMQPNRILFFDGAGNYRDEISFAGGDLGLLRRVEANGAHVTAEFARFSSAARQVFQVSAQTRPRRLFTYDRGEQKRIVPSNGPALTVGAPFAPVTVWTLLGGEHFARIDAGEQEVHVVTFAGEVTETIGLPPCTSRVTDEDRREWIYRQMDPDEVAFGREDPFRKTREEAMETLPFPDTFPPALDMKADAAAGVWVLRADKASGQIWTYVRPDEAPRTVTFPAGRRVEAFGKRYVAATARSTDDVEVVEVYDRSRILDAAR